jgi:oxamate amidohydrolase
VVLPTTGVLMHNRVSLEGGALNVLEPGRLPPHTLNPALAVLADGRVVAYGTMGGDGQPQTQAAIFTRHVRYRAPLARAIDAPRWLLGRTWGATHGNLRIALRRRARRPTPIGRARRRDAGGTLFRRHGSCRGGGAAPRWNV